MLNTSDMKILISLLFLILSLQLIAVESVQDHKFKVFANPYEIQKSPVGSTIAIATIGTALFFTEEEIRRVIRDNRTPFLTDVSAGAKLFGEGKYLFPSYLIVGGLGFAIGSNELMDTGIYALGGALLSSGVTSTLKIATQRRRPDHTEGHDFWNRSSFSVDTSFASGHTTLAFSLATVLSHQYAEGKPLLSVAFYSGATLSGLSRMYDDKHWATDVFIGSIIGYSVTKWMMVRYKSWRDKKNTLSYLELSPYLTNEGLIGLSLEF